MQPANAQQNIADNLANSFNWPSKGVVVDQKEL